MPQPAIANPSMGAGLHPAVYVLSWMVLSNATIIFNKYLLDTAGFTLTLTAIHLATATLFTQVLAHYTSLLPRPNVPITGRLYLRTLLPIGLLYTLSLACANLVYLTLSIPFIQMLKALAPVTTLLISWMASLASPRLSALGNVLLITFGVLLSSVGEIRFAWSGFLISIVGTVAESCRLLLIQTLLRGPSGRVLDEEEAAGRRQVAGMNPLLGLFYYAPVCAALNAFVAIVVEMPRFRMMDLQRVGIGMLALNSIVAFMLNVAGVFLIGKTSALTVNLSGIFKSVVLVAASILIWATPVTFTQIVGYGIALAGMLYYALPPEGLGPQIKALEAWLADRPVSVSVSVSELNVRDAVTHVSLRLQEAVPYVQNLMAGGGAEARCQDERQSGAREEATMEKGVDHGVAVEAGEGSKGE